MLHALHVVSCMLQVAHAVVASCKLHVNEARLQVDDDGLGVGVQHDPGLVAIHFFDHPDIPM